MWWWRARALQAWANVLWYGGNWLETWVGIEGADARRCFMLLRDAYAIVLRRVR